ncbi:hypothetical protein SK128_024280 [Halocaridina rubra]|uniref:Uncharacterized protein n=1 Tax=Halocaridina rubra TaxID=373956 RepID=A0AAN8XQP3_HALRR
MLPFALLRCYSNPWRRLLMIPIALLLSLYAALIAVLAMAFGIVVFVLQVAGFVVAAIVGSALFVVFGVTFMLAFPLLSGTCLCVECLLKLHDKSKKSQP